MMLDLVVERAVEVGPRRAKYDDAPTTKKMGRRVVQLSSIILYVLENIDIDDGGEFLKGSDVGYLGLCLGETCEV
jgi:hypothetical protein